MTEVDLKEFSQMRRWLYSVVEYLAAPVESQIEYLTRAGLPVDELALHFDDALHVARAAQNAGALTTAERAALRDVEVQVDKLESARQDLWEYPALESSPEWAAVRPPARAFLGEMDSHGAM